MKRSVRSTKLAEHMHSILVALAYVISYEKKKEMVGVENGRTGSRREISNSIFDATTRKTK